MRTIIHGLLDLASVFIKPEPPYVGSYNFERLSTIKQRVKNE